MPRETHEIGADVDVRIGSGWRSAQVVAYYPASGKYHVRCVYCEGGAQGVVEIERRHVRAPRRRRASVAARRHADLVDDGARAAFLDRVDARSAPRPVPKPIPPLRSRAYLDYIRSLPCAACGSPPPSEASHHGRRGVGQKTDDSLTIPLCTRCHRHWHDHGEIVGPLVDATVDVCIDSSAAAPDVRTVIALYRTRLFIANTQRACIAAWFAAKRETASRFVAQAKRAATRAEPARG